MVAGDAVKDRVADWLAISRRIDLLPDTVSRIAELLEQKARTREIGTGPRIPEIDALIEAEFEAAHAAGSDPKAPDCRAEADDLFRAILNGTAFV